MRRGQVTLDQYAFDEAAVRRDLLKTLLRSDIATVETSLDDDKFAIMISLKKPLVSEDSLNTIKRDVIRFLNAKYPVLMDFRSLGVAFENNKLAVICLFEMTE